MLDYKKLDKEITLTLQQFDKEQLERWIEFDKNRETMENLLSGETVMLELESIRVRKLSDPRENISSNTNNTFAKAA